MLLLLVWLLARFKLFLTWSKCHAARYILFFLALNEKAWSSLTIYLKNQKGRSVIRSCTHLHVVRLIAHVGDAVSGTSLGHVGDTLGLRRHVLHGWRGDYNIINISNPGQSHTGCCTGEVPLLRCHAMQSHATACDTESQWQMFQIILIWRFNVHLNWSDFNIWHYRTFSLNFVIWECGISGGTQITKEFT